MTTPCVRGISRVLLAAALAAACGAAQAPQKPAEERAHPFARDPAKDDARLFDALFPETVARLDVKNRAAAPLLDARMAEIDREIRLWETLRTYARQGRTVELADLRPSKPRAGAATDVAAERAETERARRTLEDRTSRAETARRALTDPSAAKAPTAHGKAFLDVVFEPPPPPATPASAAAKPKAPGRASLDPAGLSKALYEAGDLTGSLDAIAEIPEAKLDAEILYRKARALDRLRRGAEARIAYAAASKADPEGFFGRQARWMLELSGKTEAALAAKDERDGKAAGEKRP